MARTGFPCRQKLLDSARLHAALIPIVFLSWVNRCIRGRWIYCRIARRCARNLDGQNLSCFVLAEEMVWEVLENTCERWLTQKFRRVSWLFVEEISNYNANLKRSRFRSQWKSMVLSRIYQR